MVKVPSDEYVYFTDHGHLLEKVKQHASLTFMTPSGEVEIWVDLVTITFVDQKRNLILGVYFEGSEVLLLQEKPKIAKDGVHGTHRVSGRLNPDGTGHLRPGWGEREVKISRHLSAPAQQAV